MELDEMRDRILLATLPHVAFEGWSEASIRAGLAEADVPPGEAALAFTGGAAEMIEHWSRWADQRMLDALQRIKPESMRQRERIAAALRFRIEVNVPYREAVRRTLSFLALPPNTALAARCSYATVNAIWYACGDTATDFGFYSKRATLLAVYSATVLYWLNDDSEAFTDTWAFIDRRIDDLFRVPQLQDRAREMLGALARPWRMFPRPPGGG